MPIPTGAAVLFTAADLSTWLQDDVDDDTATTIERVVWGWLKPVLGLTVRPDPIPEEVFSWAIELGAIARENPAGLARYQLGEESSQYSVERRNEILAEAGNGGRPAGDQLRPVGSFPDRPCYPANFWER